MLKVLNLYAGIGGNRKLWKGVEVTAVEIDPKIAAVYKDFFPEDLVIVGDAHEYLLNHFEEYDFIWSSPPCPSHSRVRITNLKQNKPIYPDLKLYEEILFLKGYFKGKWVVENVISWYDPLITPFVFRNHYYWANFVISGKKNGFRGHNEKIISLEKIKGFDLSKYSGIDKNKILRNCVEPEAALTIFNSAYKTKQEVLNVE